MARKTDGIERVVQGASLPTSGGNVVIHKQGFTSNNAYGSETFSERVAPEPHDEEIL
jgi:hypothetical protein